MKINAVHFLVLFTPVVLWGQATISESERVVIKEKIELFTQEAKKWMYCDVDSSLWYAQQAVELADVIDDTRSHQFNLLIIGNGFAQLKEYQRAKEIFEKIEEMGVEDIELQIQLINEKGILQRQIRDYAAALDYHFKAKELAKDNIPLHIQTLIHIGQVYRRQKQESAALEALFAAIDLQKESGTIISSDAFIELGVVYERLGDYKMAFTYFNKALEQEKEKENIKTVIDILNRLASNYAKQENIKSSIETSQKALRLAKYHQNYKAASMACQELSFSYRYLKNYEQALEFQDLSSVYKDQLLELEKRRLVTAMQANFDLLQKESENQILRDKEKLLQQDLNRKMTMIAFFYLALFLALALMLILFKFNQSKKKTNTLLQHQNDAIQAQKLELERAMDQLKSAQIQLIQSEKMISLGRLTAGIAHEINNPVNFVYSGVAGLKKNLAALMTVIDQFDAIDNKDVFEERLQDIQQLKVEMDYQEVREDIDGLLVSIEDGAERAGIIVDRLKTFSRTDSVTLGKVNIHQNIDSTLFLIKTQIRENITIKKVYDPKLPEIESFNGQLNQVIMNLLTNAIQAIEAAGMITITTKFLKKEKSVEVSIADTGKGIPKVDQFRIFEPFYTTKEVGQGTGLGLSISYGIIQKHQGQIEVDSEVGKGTVFRITLPLVQKNE